MGRSIQSTGMLGIPFVPGAPQMKTRRQLKSMKAQIYGKVNPSDNHLPKAATVHRFGKIFCTKHVIQRRDNRPWCQASCRIAHL